PENSLPIAVQPSRAKARNDLSTIWIISMGPFMSVPMAHISLMMVGSGIRVEYPVFGVSIAGCLTTSGNPKTVRRGYICATAITIGEMQSPGLTRDSLRLEGLARMIS